MSKRSVARIAAAFFVGLTLMAMPASSAAQSGSAKKAKVSKPQGTPASKVSKPAQIAASPKVSAKAPAAPDSSAGVKDSLAKLHATVSYGEVALPVDSAPKKQSRFARARSAAGKASAKFEKTTGISTKDAALAASGVGIGTIAAKKMGVDPASIAAKAIAKNDSTRKPAPPAQGAPPGSMPPGAMMGMPNAAAVQQQQQMQAGMAAPRVSTAAMLEMPDAQLMIAFQQEIMQVSMDAAAGNPVARARLEGWNKLTAKYQAEAVPLTTAASAGDLAALTRLQALQVGMMREWLRSYGASETKGRKP